MPTADVAAQRSPIRAPGVGLLASALVVLSCACSGGSDHTNTATPSGAGTTRPSASATRAPAPPLTVPPGPAASQTAGASSSSKLTVTGGAIGGNATATMRTSPAAACTITYTTPSGELQADAGLNRKTAGADGVVSWTWPIAGGRPGQGRVTVNCGADQATATIPIAP